MRSGTRFISGHLTFSWVENQEGNARLALVVPRYGHTAVSRNRLRRRLREIARRNFLASLPAVDVVIRTRPRTYNAGFETLRNELLEWYRSLVSC